MYSLLTDSKCESNDYVELVIEILVYTTLLHRAQDLFLPRDPKYINRLDKLSNFIYIYICVCVYIYI